MALILTIKTRSKVIIEDKNQKDLHKETRVALLTVHNERTDHECAKLSVSTPSGETEHWLHQEEELKIGETKITYKGYNSSKAGYVFSFIAPDHISINHESVYYKQEKRRTEGLADPPSGLGR